MFIKLKHGLSIGILGFTILMNGCSGTPFPAQDDTNKWANMSLDTFSGILEKKRGLSKFDKVREKKYQYEFGQTYYFAPILCKAKSGIEKDFDFDFINVPYRKACFVDNKPIYFMYGKNEKSGYFDYSVTTKKAFNDRLAMLEQQKQDYRMQLANEQQLKKLAEKQALKEKEILIQKLRDRNGQFMMTFYDSWAYSGTESTCANICIEANEANTGYRSLQDAINDGWKFISQISNTKRDMNHSCKCQGANILLEHK
ncbi:hypothetical protein [Sulfurimonas microaerophilic]|uniref:hypothetical protein n=1 Tax=Sulfurimonas microaerophilic TaxID=3058392 RepID=UPI002714E7DC|nr:hypothetical protein [Sulfurimonas sp. hsl 1-7]